MVRVWLKQTGPSICSLLALLQCHPSWPRWKPAELRLLSGLFNTHYFLSANHELLPLNRSYKSGGVRLIGSGKGRKKSFFSYGLSQSGLFPSLQPQADGKNSLQNLMFSMQRPQLPFLQGQGQSEPDLSCSLLIISLSDITFYVGSCQSECVCS